jgi:hypothetical protein
VPIAREVPGVDQQITKGERETVCGVHLTERKLDRLIERAGHAQRSVGGAAHRVPDLDQIIAGRIDIAGRAERLGDHALRSHVRPTPRHPSRHNTSASTSRRAAPRPNTARTRHPLGATTPIPRTPAHSLVRDRDTTESANHSTFHPHAAGVPHRATVTFFEGPIAAMRGCDTPSRFARSRCDKPACSRMR